MSASEDMNRLLTIIKQNLEQAKSLLSNIINHINTLPDEEKGYYTKVLEKSFAIDGRLREIETNIIHAPDVRRLSRAVLEEKSKELDGIIKELDMENKKLAKFAEYMKMERAELKEMRRRMYRNYVTSAAMNMWSHLIKGITFPDELRRHIDKKVDEIMRNAMNEKEEAKLVEELVNTINSFINRQARPTPSKSEIMKEIGEEEEGEKKKEGKEEKRLAEKVRKHMRTQTSWVKPTPGSGIFNISSRGVKPVDRPIIPIKSKEELRKRRIVLELPLLPPMPSDRVDELTRRLGVEAYYHPGALYQYIGHPVVATNIKVVKKGINFEIREIPPPDEIVGVIKDVKVRGERYTFVIMSDANYYIEVGNAEFTIYSRQ